MGSSPRVRGKPVEGLQTVLEHGLIPARAGKTPAHVDMSSPFPAHPRACGENWSQLIEYGDSAGSSPRVRGKRVLGEGHGGGLRLIPARAGKTTQRPSPACRSWAHPRACGENGRSRCVPSAGQGSSPRVRGKRTCGWRDWNPRGLIPARAGKTGHVLQRRRDPRAHPRACGENVQEVSLVAIPAGSSPRVRGKRSSPMGLSRWRRLIPARAGKTPRPSCRSP